MLAAARRSACSRATRDAWRGGFATCLHAIVLFTPYGDYVDAETGRRHGNVGKRRDPNRYAMHNMRHRTVILRVFTSRMNRAKSTVAGSNGLILGPTGQNDQNAQRETSAPAPRHLPQRLSALPFLLLTLPAASLLLC